jgi:hypothetical protein
LLIIFVLFISFLAEKNLPIIVPINSTIPKDVPSFTKSSDLKRDHDSILQDSPVKNKKAKTSKKSPGNYYFCYLKYIF